MEIKYRIRKWSHKRDEIGFRGIRTFPFLPTPLTTLSLASRLCIGQIEASTCPPPGIPRAFDTFAVPGRREFDHQSLPGGGEFELHPRFHVKSLAWRAIMGDARGIGGFSWKRLCLCSQLVTRKGLKQAFCRI